MNRIKKTEQPFQGFLLLSPLIWIFINNISIEGERIMKAEDFLEIGMTFHGHKCPAMPLGLRAGAAAMNTLGVLRSQDKELHIISETGKGHAAGCFLDGIMVITGCTYGKSNIEKQYLNKMAFTLIDVKNQKAVRVILKSGFFENMLKSPFVQQRKNGILPQDVPAEIADPLVKKVMSLPEDEFLDIGPVVGFEFKRSPGTFDILRCSICHEAGFSNKFRIVNAKPICPACIREALK